MKGRLVVLLAIGSVVALVACGRSPSGTATPQSGSLRPLAGSNSLVISQVYGGGGNTGAPYTHDFIEIFNRSENPVSLTGFSLQYASATGTGNFGQSGTQLTELPNVVLQPRQYFLVQEAGGSTGTALPAPDLTDATPILLSATSGKVALVSGTTTLGCNGGSAPCDAAAIARIVDLVGFGGANYFEGTGPTPAPSNINAVLRKNGGFTDTDNNAADFLAGPPTPRNSGNALEVPSTVTLVGPANGATAPTNADLTVVFSEDMTVTGAWLTLTCAGNPVALTLSGSGRAYNGDTQADLPDGASCTATVLAGAVSDVDSIDPPDGLAADYSWNFTIGAPGPARIRDIQGAAHMSPLKDAKVSSVPGVVTAVTGSGFFMQDPTSDGDDATSEGILVYTGSAPKVAAGDDVWVSGEVTEFRPGGASSTNLTTTEITGPLVSINGRGRALPATTTIGTGGRVPPSSIIEDDAGGSVEEGGIFDPGSDGIDFYESLEGMRVQVNNPVATGPSNNFGEISVLADGGANAGVRTSRGGIVIGENDFNPERIILDDLLISTPVVNTGDHFSGPAVGVIDYNFSNFKLLITQAINAVSAGISREAATDPLIGQLTVATFNVENLDAQDPASKFEEIAGLIVNNLRSPDLLALEEVQDDNGATNNGVVSAGQTLTKLTAAIASAGGPTYAYKQINPVNNQDGGEPGGNIRVAFLYRADRGLAFNDRGSPSATAGTEVIGTGGTTSLTLSPGRIDPTNLAWVSSRKPLAGEFTYRGQKLFVIANHFNSKGGDQPLFGRFQPPTLTSEIQRLQQAEVVADFVTDLLTASPAANVVVLGDLNDFQFSKPLKKLKDVGLNILIDTLPENERYTYVFEGNSQALDHTLTSPGASHKVRLYDVVHVNSEFADQASDHDPQVSYLSFPQPAALALPGQINLKDKNASVVPVTVLSTPDLDATKIDPSTATLGDSAGTETSVTTRPNLTYQTEVRDVDLDGDLDLTLMFATAEFVANKDLKAGTNTLYFYGLLYDNLTQVVGSAQVRAK